jgi:hypothetical protein
MEWTKRQDLPKSGHASAPGLQLNMHRFVGEWTNTNRQTGGVMDVKIADRDGDLVVRVFGVGDPEPCDWGETTAKVFALGVESAEGEAFCANYDLGFMEVMLQARANLGLLVVAFYSRFKDGSGRADYFIREFYRPV